MIEDLSVSSAFSAVGLGALERRKSALPSSCAAVLPEAKRMIGGSSAEPILATPRRELPSGHAQAQLADRARQVRNRIVALGGGGIREAIAAWNIFKRRTPATDRRIAWTT